MMSALVEQILHYFIPSFKQVLGFSWHEVQKFRMNIISNLPVLRCFPINILYNLCLFVL